MVLYLNKKINKTAYLPQTPARTLKRNPELHSTQTSPAKKNHENFLTAASVVVPENVQTFNSKLNIIVIRIFWVSNVFFL